MYYYTLDGVEYPLINLYSIPVGYGEVEVEIGEPTRDRAPGVLLAGHIAYTACAKETELHAFAGCCGSCSGL